ncbi:MAG: WbuC family cupin fold metalloprotein [Blastocatellia bacterium]
MRVQKIDSKLLDELLEKARQSPRRRAVHRLHDDDWEHAHRMLNALTHGTYVCPHRHESRFNGEGFILLRGRLAVLIFDDDGNVVRDKSYVLSATEGRIGMDIAPMVWHSLVALEESVIYEVKGQPTGGYIQADDKNFAPWAPAEGEAGVAEYLQKLEAIAATI